MSTLAKRILTGVILLLVVAMAFYPKLKPLFSAETPEEKKAAAAPTGPGKTTVEVQVVGGQSLDDRILTTGTIMPNEEVEIRSEVSGRITGIYFREGDVVRQGAVLLRINDADLQAQLQKLEYTKKLAEVNEQRQHQLLQKEAISRQEYDIAQTNLNSILADIENLRAQLAKTVLRAPFDGTIGLRAISTGGYLDPSRRVATLTNMNPAKLDFSVPAKYVGQIGRGSRVEFTVEGSTQRRQAVVYAVEPKVDPQTRTLLLRASAPNPNRMLVPGAFAKVQVVLGSRGNAIVVPTEAVIPESGGQKVYVVRNSKAEAVVVQTGLRTANTVEIRQGLQPGDSLITTGVQIVKPGGEVTVAGSGY